MSKVKTFALILGLAATSAGAQALERQSGAVSAGRLATPHQYVVVRGVNVSISPDLGTPGAQLLAEPAEGRVNPAAFGEFPGTVHQASIGLRQVSAPQ